MFIYRIEDAHGCGPYTTSLKSKWMFTSHDDSYRHPVPFMDNKIKIFILSLGNDRHLSRFGFETLSALYEWFSDDELDRLTSLGFNIVEYFVNDYALGSKQIVFNINSAKKIQDIQYAKKYCKYLTSVAIHGLRACK